MIPDLQASLLCDDVRQEVNGKFILIGIFDGVTVPKLPMAMMRMCVVNRWCAGSGAFKQLTRIIAPDGLTEVLRGREVEIKLGASEQTATSVEVFVNPKFQNPGVYWVEVLLDGALRMRYPFAIRVKRPPPRTPPPPGV